MENQEVTTTNHGSNDKINDLLRKGIKLLSY